MAQQQYESCIEACNSCADACDNCTAFNRYSRENRHHRIEITGDGAC
jgi:hypothetical protein